MSEIQEKLADKHETEADKRQTSPNQTHAAKEENPVTQSGNRPLRYWVEYSLDKYFANLGEQQVQDIYKLVINEVERALIKTVLKHAKNNQSKAANWLGIARGTLRTRIKDYALVNEDKA